MYTLINVRGIQHAKLYFIWQSMFNVVDQDQIAVEEE